MVKMVMLCFVIYFTPIKKKNKIEGKNKVNEQNLLGKSKDCQTRLKKK